MRRRAFIAGLMGATVALPVPVWSQPGKVYRVSFLSYRGCSASLDTNGAFREGLREAGYVEGKNLLLECRDAPGRVDRFPELALELVRLKSDVLIAEGTPASLSAKQVTTTVPIVLRACRGPGPQWPCPKSRLSWRESDRGFPLCHRIEPKTARSPQRSPSWASARGRALERWQSGPRPVLERSTRGGGTARHRGTGHQSERRLRSGGEIC